MKKLLLALAAALLLPAVASAQTSSGAGRVQGTGDVNRGDPVNVRQVTCSAGTCTEVAGGGGGGGGAVTVADGADITQGAKADASACSGTVSTIALLKCIAAAAIDTTTPVPVTCSGTWDVTVPSLLSLLPASIGSKLNTTSLAVAEPKSSTGTITSTAASASSVVVLTANGARNGCSIVNDSSSNAKINLGATASSTSFVAEMLGASSAPHAQFICPSDYTGAISMIWDSATGNARASERTN